MTPVSKRWLRLYPSKRYDQLALWLTGLRPLHLGNPLFFPRPASTMMSLYEISHRRSTPRIQDLQSPRKAPKRRALEGNRGAAHGNPLPPHSHRGWPPIPSQHGAHKRVVCQHFTPYHDLIRTLYSPPSWKLTQVWDTVEYPCPSPWKRFVRIGIHLNSLSW